MIASTFDLASLLLYVFWAFFAALIWYLHRENKREGYPLETDAHRKGLAVVGYPAPPPTKTYRMMGGEEVVVADGRPDTRPVKATPVAAWFGAPLEPTGNPMVDGVGPAAYAERADHLDMTIEGLPKIVPLRVATDFYLETRDPDPRGMKVKGDDGQVAGVVKDCWIDRSEYVMRYYEVELPGGKTVLLPSNFARVDGGKREIRVKAVFAKHFADAPTTKDANSITLLEEDRICGYFGGGYLYAHPSRAEPIL